MQAVKELDAESKVQDEGTALEQQSDKTTKESSQHFSNAGTEVRAGGKGAKIEKVEKERECPQQREAVIRPQQAGKIDFRSLQNRSKLTTDRTWSTGKGPQSPSGKGRGREKGKRSGKTERGNPQQLYRLSITNPRSNPTIGIAYPQQKVSPPKKLETSRGPVSGSYRFHVPSIPEREAELQQEELSFGRCFQEASSNLTCSSYTSQALVSSSGAASHPHPPLSQQPASMENSSGQPGNQLMLADFQLGVSNTWQSPERTFNGANYGVSSQKATALTEASKVSAYSPAPFQYAYHFIEESTADSFPCEQSHQSQDFADSSLGSVHMTHNSFPFMAEEGQNTGPKGSQFANEQQTEDRGCYPQASQPQFIPGVVSSMQCPRILSEDSASSDSSGSSSQQSEHGKSTLPESADIIGQADSRDAAITAGNKRNCHPKDTAANQRALIPGSVHHARNIPQGPGSQLHFSNKTFNNLPVGSVHSGSMAFDKNINNKVLNRLPPTWEGPNKTYSQSDQNTIQYTDMNDKFHFQSQPALDQRSNSSKNGRMPWQQIRPGTAMPNQNRIELSRQMSSQKLTYMVSSADWQDDNKTHKHSSLKSIGSFQNGRSGDGFSSQRHGETVKHSSGTVSGFKAEMNHVQACDSKSKAVYFGLNQALPTAPTRTYSYPPLQVAPMGLRMVSPYDSPLPSPVHNASSTCSSLSPASTSPVNISSEDSQMSKPAALHPFYHQSLVKTQLASEQLGSNPHQFHPEAPRHLSYAPDRAKDDMMSYLQNSSHPKAGVDVTKGYVDSFGVEHHQPPPPYSAHQLLATSLATANLDQLDVLLTCKQCDQNFNNLASFLGHKQYCTQQAFSQNELKDTAKMEESRKFHAEPAKAGAAVPNVSMSRCPSDLHLSLLGLNKNGEPIPDSEAKRDIKDDATKLSIFPGSSNLPVPLPELDMDDAKLDSLITEALNRLGCQSDNADIDSIFMDAFVDDELTTVKATSNKQCLKTKESLFLESKSKQSADDDRPVTQERLLYESDVESPERDKQRGENKQEKIHLNLEQNDKNSMKKEASPKSSRFATREQDRKDKEASKLCKSEEENTNTQRFLLSSKFSERCGTKSFQDSCALKGSAPAQAASSPTSKTAVKDTKRKSTGGGSWSKELIHKIVQQKNKLHKLHVKGTKNLQFSLVMERLTPTVQNPAFGEYDYVSDTDDECEPVKIASQGRLNQSSRCKYTYTKECKWRARSEREQAAWRHESKECFQVKKSDEVSVSPEKHSSHQRLRRRGSRSSTSSELSTSVSVSSDSISSPKSADRTDSDCEKADVKKKESPGRKPLERSSPQKLCRESGTLALTFTKSAKRNNADKAATSESNDRPAELKTHHSNPAAASSLPNSQKNRDAYKSVEKGRTSHTYKWRGSAVSPRKEAGRSDGNALQRTEDLCPKEEPTTQCSSPDTKPLRRNSLSHSISRETDFNMDSNAKDKTGESPRGSQARLSDSGAFEKETAELVNDLDAHKAASLCSSLMDEVCLSPVEAQGPLIQKDTLHLMTYSLDQEQGLMKSPLSFDTTSMFGDLAGFESGLYQDMPIQKEAFHALEGAADKKEEFVSSLSPFLEHREWNLNVSPLLPEEVSQYKGNSEKPNEKKADYSHVPLSLPEKIIDYSAHSCTSEEELEIKRIVNELETQLQTTRIESPPALAQAASKDLKMSKFSPLRLDDDPAGAGPGLDLSCPVQTLDVPVSSLPSEPFSEPWSSPFQFDLISSHRSPHTSVHNELGALEPCAVKEDSPLRNLIGAAPHAEQPQMQHAQNPEKRHADKELCAEEKDDALEEKRRTESLMRSLKVMSDSIFKKVPILSDDKWLNVTPLEQEQQHQEIECQATDAVAREDQSKREAITGEENILSPPNINERKDDIKFSLNESQPSPSNGTDPAVNRNHPISSQPSAPTENNDTAAEAKVTSAEDIAENSNVIECAHHSSVGTHDPLVAEVSGRNSNAADNASQLFKTISDRAEQLSTESGGDAEAAKGITGQSVRHPLSPAALADSGLDTGGIIQDAIKVALEGQAAHNRDNPAGISLSHNSKLKEGCSGIVMEEITGDTAESDCLTGLPSFRSCSPIKTCSASPTTGMPAEIREKTLSPILVENHTEGSGHGSPGSTHLLIISQPENVDMDSCKMTSLSDSLKCETGLAFDSIQKTEEILNVQDIKEHLPVDFMASHQNSPCREEEEEEEESQCLFLHGSPPTSPLLAVPHQTPMQKWDMEEDPSQAQSECNNTSDNQASIQMIKSPIYKNEDRHVKEGISSDEQLCTTVEMEYSLISPPSTDSENIVSKIPSSATATTSEQSATHAAETGEVSTDLEKRAPVCHFNLSPLNYNSIADEPPQLNQFDYIPISPASRPEENHDMEQSSGVNCVPCDLSIHPNLMFKNTETSAAMPLNAEPTSLVDAPLVLQQSMKYLCFSFGPPPEEKSEVSEAAAVETDLQVCHNPAASVDHLQTHAHVLREDDTDGSDSYMASAESAEPIRDKTSDDSSILKSLIICENEQIPFQAGQSENQALAEADNSSSAFQAHKEMSPKKARNNAAQGKVLCEICLMCFRTVPGLKRHKAMKHLVRNEKHIGPQSATSSHQEAMLIYEASQATDKEHKDDSQTCCRTKIDGPPEACSTFISKAAETELVLEEMASETSAVAVDEIGIQNPLQPVKSKKYNKARKSKNSEVNTKADPFSDELLNILKTDILQAITPEFKSSGLQGQHISPEGQEKINDRSVSGTEKFPHRVTSKCASDSAPQSPGKDTKLLNKSAEPNQTTDSEEIEPTRMAETANGEVRKDSAEQSVIGMCQDIIKECSESTEAACAAEGVCEQKGSEDILAREILQNVAVEIKCEKNSGVSDDSHPLSCLSSSPRSPPGLSPELKALLDDDTTFSQLFPRDEEAKRKKCPRVYSKKNKRPKLSLDSGAELSAPETLAQHKEQPSESRVEPAFPDRQPSPCEYETISIDDAIMLNMCHNGTSKADPLPSADAKQANQPDGGDGMEEADLESNAERTADEHAGSCESDCAHTDLNVTKAQVPNESGALPPTPNTVEPSAPESVQSQHTIDIQNINTTFQLPDIQFLNSSRDVTLTPPSATVDVENRDEEKSKAAAEQRGRKRQDSRLKVKDKQYKCKVCFTWFLTLGELNFHKLSHNPSPPPTCYMCVQRKFSSREQLRDHLSEKHAKNKTGIWTCGMCLKEISDVWMYNEHLREHATQFARRGQTQGSMLGISGCFMQETAVKNFITSILQHRPSKSNRESSKSSKEQGGASHCAAVGGGKSSEAPETKVHKSKSSSGAGGKQSTLTPLEVLHKTEAPRSVEMHPNCKDPSRDCHHCGKQFPKPFKLQRHLVVHNVEKIFLCHKCPVTYQDAQELKNHLKRAHEEVDEPESKHTTLYTCELCADVMHVIKKSFICSTCNYTFSKKEQFDRHMEKHLSSSNKIFKYRGVLRPVRVPSSKVEESESPAAKKRRILSDSQQENSSDSGIASVSSLHLNQNSEAQPSKPSVSTADDSTQTTAAEYHRAVSNASVKTEDTAEDYPELLAELENRIQADTSDSTPPKEEEVDPATSTAFENEGIGESVTEPCEVKEESESVCIRVETSLWSLSEESSGAGGGLVRAKDASAVDITAEAVDGDDPRATTKESSSAVSTENPTLSSTPESAKRELDAKVAEQQREDEQWHQASKAGGHDSKRAAPSHHGERESDGQTKDRVAPDSAKSAANGNAKAAQSSPALPPKVSLSEDSDSLRPQKKRKDSKSAHSLQRVASPATQENFGVDSRPKKKFRPSKCANATLQRKSDGPADYPVLSSVRDDVVSNKIVAKKASNLGLQARKGLLDSCAPKKAEIVTPMNGDYKAKKGALGRPLHSPISKVPSVPMNNSLNKSRPKMGVRSMEGHSYRTAESQNHLLSQLFGSGGGSVKKLTSFKIPLRKDTSESIN